ncbi:MFS transporter [Candidatus Parvarchaeota archaeon]|nr:MFS transporter [Candidatus Parvarchaeota archaeon]
MTDVKDTSNIVQRIDRLPLTRYLFFVAMVAATGYFFDIFDIDTISVTIGAIKHVLTVTPLLTTLTIAMAFIGMFFGSIFFGRLGDKYGRKKIFTITLIIIALGSFLTFLVSFAPSISGLWITRFITGFGIGGDLPVIWAYMGELIPTRYRGRYYGMSMIIGVLSIPAVSFFATYVLSFSLYNWGYVFLVGAVVAFAVLPLRALVPESPRWYLSHGRHKEAEKSMRIIESKVRASYKKALPPYDRSVHYSILEEKTPLRDLFSKKLRVRTASASLLWIFQTWAFYGVAAFLPLILIAKGFTIVTAVFYASIGYTGGFLGPVTVAIVSDRFQRKNLLMFYAALAGILAVSLGLTPAGDLALLLVLAFLINLFMQAWASTLYAYVPELFPARSRASAGGLANGLGRGFNVVGLLVIGVALAASPAAQLSFVAISWFVCVAVLAVTGVKTSKITLEDISEKRASRSSA